MRVVDELLGAVVYQLHVGLGDPEVAAEDYLLNREDLRVELRAAQELVEIANVLDLARLGHSIPLLLEPLPSVIVHHFLFVLENAHEQEEAADDGSRASLTMVAVKYRYTVGICA